MGISAFFNWFVSCDRGDDHHRVLDVLKSFDENARRKYRDVARGGSLQGGLRATELYDSRIRQHFNPARLKDELERALGEGGVDLETRNENGDTALLILVGDRYNCNVVPVKALIDAGANVNTQDKDGYTPLMLSVLSGDLATFNLLLRRAAKLDLKTSTEMTVLDIISVKSISGRNMRQEFLDAFERFKQEREKRLIVRPEV